MLRWWKRLLPLSMSVLLGNYQWCYNDGTGFRYDAVKALYETSYPNEAKLLYSEIHNCSIIIQGDYQTQWRAVNSTARP